MTTSVETYIEETVANRTEEPAFFPTWADGRFDIPLDCWGDFIKLITKLNKKAVKLGCDPITYDFLGQGLVERTFYWKDEHSNQRSRTVKVEAKSIQLHGNAPKLEGFNFIARIEYLADGTSTLFHTVPGVTTKIDERFRGLGLHVCEHCNKVRRRNDVFIVEEVSTSKQTQVGRTCLADFTGITDPRRLVAGTARLSIFEDLREFGGRAWREYHANTVDTLEILAITSAVIATHGWVPKSAAQFSGTSTASWVAHCLDIDFIRVHEPKSYAAIKALVDLSAADEHKERAATVQAWIKDELADTARSDYELNLVTLVKGELCERKHLGIVCSTVAAWQRANNRKVEYAERKKKLADSKHLDSKIGDRLREVPCTVQFAKAMEGGQFGPTTLVKFLTEDGNLLTWFASGDRDYRPGEKLALTFTVKQFKEYNGVKETQITRAKPATVERKD